MPALVVMGVSGSGKSTVGAALAQRLGVPFVDGDDLHPPENVAKMAAGQALDDEDRRPWLDAVGEWLAAHADGGVIACSALKRRYRDQLRRYAPDAELVLLRGSRGVIERRQASRHGHFMPTSLLGSQLATLEPLEPDERGIEIDVDQSLGAIVEAYLDAARNRPGGEGVRPGMSEKQALVPDSRHPITITPTPGRVVVMLGDRTVADTGSALTLQEADYPAVQYVPLADVDPAVLRSTDHATYCPYKGDASYYSLEVDGQTYDNAVWTYQAPYPAVSEIAGHVAFYPDVVEVRTSR